MAGSAFVTGGSGFVGGAVVRHLLRDGWDVVVLARARAGEDALGRAGARPVRGDVLYPSTLATAMSGCDTVFHVAALNASCLRDPSPLFRTNVEGTRNALEAAAASGVRRFVHTSSAATIGEESGAIGREDTPHRGWFLTAYERSKFDAERLVLERGPALGLEVVCVNPTSVQGPGRLEGTAQLVLAAARGRLPVAVDVWLSFVDVDDCARGHVLAAERGRPGRRYLLSGGSLRSREALRMLDDIVGRRSRRVFVPGGAVFVTAPLIEAAARISGREPVICREVVRAGLHGHRYDGSLASRKLGLAYTSPEETLRRILAFASTEGRLAGRTPSAAHAEPPSAYDSEPGTP